MIVGLLVAAGFTGPGSSSGHPQVAHAAVGHIHGIAVDPADDQVYVGAHLGVFAIEADGATRPVGVERHDFMDFTITDSGLFLASGHPDLTTAGPPHLGLIESLDAAKSWHPASLRAGADFHALDASDGRVWGLNSITGDVLVSSDRRVRDRVDTIRGTIDLAVDPTNADRAMVTLESGSLLAYGRDPAGRSVLLPAPVLTYVDWPSSDALVGIGPDGTIRVSRDRAATWRTAGTVDGKPTALTATRREWYVATTAGLFVSRGGGETWDVLLADSEAP